jgi:allantoinase
MHKVPNRGDICKVREVISKATGKPPRGWIGPGLTETWETHDLLVEGGCDYVADWVLDDQPVWLKTRTKPMLAPHHKASEYCDCAHDQFEQIYADSAESARVMALSIHPYIIEAPHQLKYLRRVIEVTRSPTGIWLSGQRHPW